MLRYRFRLIAADGEGCDHQMNNSAPKDSSTMMIGGTHTQDSRHKRSRAACASTDGYVCSLTLIFQLLPYRQTLCSEDGAV